MRKVDTVALILANVGALTWGLVAVAEFDLVATMFGMEFGETSAISRVLYGLVGLSFVWLAVRFATILGHSRTSASAVTA